MARIELLVNTQCDGQVTLARVRGNSNAKTFKFSNEKKLLNLSKGDGILIETEELVERGNYIVPANYKIIDTHISGKKLDASAYLDSLVQSVEETIEPAF